MLLNFISSCPSVKADVSLVRYLDEPIFPIYSSKPIGVIIDLPRTLKLKKLGKRLASLKKLTLIQIRLSSSFKYAVTSKKLLTVLVDYLTENFPQVRLAIEGLSSTWKTSAAFGYLRSLPAAAITTHYLENELIYAGWARDLGSKRIPFPVLTYQPKIRGSVHVVLWGPYGPGIGSYSVTENGFVTSFVSELLKAVRYFRLKKVWIELRNDEGAVSAPYPAASITMTGIQDFDFVPGPVVTVLPQAKGETVRPSVLDARKIREEWDRQLFLLDGLGP